MFGGETILMNEAGDTTALVFGEKDESDDDEVLYRRTLTL